MTRRTLLQQLTGALASFYTPGFVPEKWNVDINGRAFQEPDGQVHLQKWSFSLRGDHAWVEDEVYPLIGHLKLPTLVYGWTLPELMQLAENMVG